MDDEMVRSSTAGRNARVTVVVAFAVTRRNRQADVETTPDPSRRRFLSNLSLLAGAALLAPGRLLGAASAPAITRAIPKTAERVPVLGMGSWITFNVPPFDALRSSRVEVLRAFFAHGGAVVDSSPMYGYSEEVIGHCLERLSNDSSLFSATKVWTPTAWLGEKQIAESHDLWGVDRFSLLQVHNMLDWEAHLDTLERMKSRGTIRYIGITTSHGRRHAALERVMKSREAFDFVQLTYNILDREAEERLLPLAADQGLGVLINRPFRRGALIDELSPHPLPPWAGEIGCATWPQFLLKFIVSHPAVTCAIPATSRVDHMNENMQALRGRLPDSQMRRRMVRYVESL